MSEEDQVAEARELARALLRYLHGHPQAKDSLEGVARWWLGPKHTERLLEDVGRAVALLLTHDLVLETRRPGTPPYYQLNVQKGAAIAEIIADASWLRTCMKER